MKILSNCWDSLKTVILQHSDEKCADVNVTKVEKNNCMAYGVNLSAVNNGKSATKPRTGERSTTSKTCYTGIGLQAIGSPKW